MHGLRIRNFQSHRDTAIKLDPGVNAIVCSSDQGKSAVLRALLWAISNRPSGMDGMLSHWARNEKGKITEPMSVAVAAASGSVERYRDNDENKYTLTNSTVKEFKAVNKDVPEDIANFFSLTDVNIQAQHDPPFLLSASAGDVAKYFNKMVRLDVIDKVLASAESARREQGKNIKSLEAEKGRLEKELHGYEWIEAAKGLSEKLAAANGKIGDAENIAGILGAAIESYRAERRRIKALPDAAAAGKLIGDIEKAQKDLEAFEIGKKHLGDSVRQWEQKSPHLAVAKHCGQGKKLCSAILHACGELRILTEHASALALAIGEHKTHKRYGVPFDVAEKDRILDGLREARQSLKGLNAELLALGDSVGECERHAEIMGKSWLEIKRLKDAMPDLCPTCGQSMAGAKISCIW